MATINGTGGDDTLNGTSSNDTITGDGGNDSISAGGDGDSVDGGSGNDTIRGDGGNDTIQSGEGDDSIDSGAENDSVDAGEGNDSVFGSGGADTIDGGTGDDTLRGGSENDSIQGGEGQDSIEGGSGQDTISGGAGNDSITGNDDADSIQGNDGDDTIDGGSGTDSIEGNRGQDSISGGNDSDTIHGYNDNDTIRGDAGQDKLYGGTGDDVIDGGADVDTIEGGHGNDTLTGGDGDDTFVIRDGHGTDVITDFAPGKDKIAFDMSEMNSYSDVLSRMTEDGGNTVITFDNGDSVTLQGVSNASLSSSDFAYSAGPVCLMEGTLIQTERGEIAIEALRPDDIIWTKDHGWQAIRMVTFERMKFKHRDDPAKPILIPKGALGQDTPKTDLITSPQHRILQVYPKTGREVLVPAVKLIGRNGIRRMRGKKSAHYLNIVMERHSIIQAAGCWVESLLVTSRSLERQGAAARRLMDHCRNMKPARRIEDNGVRPRRLRRA